MDMSPCYVIRALVASVKLEDEREMREASRFREAMNYLGGCSKWEDMILIQVRKTSMIHGFTAWRLMECEHYFETTETF